MIIAAVVIFQSFSSVAGHGPTSVAVMAHLGGLAAGYFLLRGKWLYTRGNVFASDTYKDWKLRRAKKKFQALPSKERLPARSHASLRSPACCSWTAQTKTRPITK